MIQISRVITFDRWDGSRRSLWNQFREQTNLPVVDRHDGQLLLEPLCRAADQSVHCDDGGCLHQEETKVEPGLIVASKAKRKITLTLVFLGSC